MNSIKTKKNTLSRMVNLVPECSMLPPTRRPGSTFNSANGDGA